MVVTTARRWQSGCAGNGRPPALPCGAREGLPWRRIAEKLDLTLRLLLKELADRGLVVSYYALCYLHHEGVIAQKKLPRLRTGLAGRR